MPNTSTNFIVPLVINHNTKASIYGETGPNLIFNYEFTDVSGFTLTQMKDTFKYKDSDSGSGPFLKYDISSQHHITNNDWHNLLVNTNLGLSNNKYRNSTTSPIVSPLASHVIQWISSTLFGHPLAQAPLTNETQIIEDISNGTYGSTDTNTNTKLGYQIYNELSGPFEQPASNENGTQSNEILKSIYEQMVNQNRFNQIENSGTLEPQSVQDTDGFISLPFEVGDRMSFLINIGCNLFNDSNDFNNANNGIGTSTNTSLEKLFSNLTKDVQVVNNNVSLVPETWKFNFIVTADP